MKRLKVLSEGVLYRNPNPGFKAECAFLPNVVPLSQTEVTCFYRLGSAFDSVDGKLAKLRSTDGGRSWATEGVVWDPRNDQVPYSYSQPHATRFKDGSMALIAFRVEYSDVDLQAFYNPDTGGARPVENVLFRSEDGGHTWSEPEVMAIPEGGHAPSQIIELDNGRWLLVCEVMKGWDDASPHHDRGFTLFSDDMGKTWTAPVDLPSGSDKEKMYAHSRYTRMLDGRVAALQWTQEVGTEKDLDLHLTISDKEATKWTYPRPTGIMGQTSWMADLGDGVLVATYTQREGEKPGIMVILSEDEGETWDLENQVMVWDAVGQEYLGTDRLPNYENIAFGKPNTARLPNGEIVSSWWCTQACVTHARFARLAVE